MDGPVQAPHRHGETFKPGDAPRRFLEMSRAFVERSRELGLEEEIARFQWYHTIDLGEGLVTPGLYDYRETIAAFGFAGDMRGMSVLDVGSATGFFAFEFERRGARVVSIELPSIAQLDRFPGQHLEGTLRKIERMLVPDTLDPAEFVRPRYTAAQLYRYLLDGPFHFCHGRLGSAVERRYSTVYDLTLAGAGAREPFDLVFLGDVLVHTLDPLGALGALAPLCRGTLVVAGEFPGDLGEPPAMAYVGGPDPESDHISWWQPNMPCLVQMLSKLGFSDIRHVGNHSGTLNPSGYPFTRAIVHATKRPAQALRRQAYG